NYQTKTAPAFTADVAQLQTNLKIANDALQTAQLKNLQVQADPTSSTVDKIASQNQLTAAQATLASTQTNLSKIQQGTAQVDLAAAQSQVDNTRTALQAAQTNYNNLVALSDLATRPETAALNTAQAAYKVAQAAYAAKLAPPRAQDVGSAQAAVFSAQAGLDNANTGVDNALAAARNANVAVDTARQAANNARVSVDTARQTTDTARTAVNSAQIAADTARTAVGSAQVAADTARTAVGSAQAAADNARVTAANSSVAVDSAQQAVNNAGLAANTAKANVPSAQSSVDAAQAKLSQTIAGPLPTDVKQAVETVNQAKLALQTGQFNLDNAVLRSPFAGVVVSIPATATAGSQATGSTIIATVVNPNQIEVDANVDETSIVQLKPGQQATVTFDAISGRTFQGTVAVVTPSGTTQGGVVVFPAVVRINNQGQTIPAGLSANITVLISATPNVLAVPSRYVHRQGQGQAVDVLVNGKRDSRTVTTGVTNGQQTEIKSGLNQGDLVLAPQQSTAQRGAGAFGAGGNLGGGPPANP
ncbi:MAG: HlyD family efflux transporter periplasmic adaptor subunit, partial [Dehalococcoidia bacterium]